MTTRKKKPEKSRKATPKRAASVAAERDAARAFELGEQMTALRQERDEAQAELAEVVKVLDKLAPRDQYGSISAAVLEALEAHRKQRDEAARLGAVEVKAAQAQLEEAQAQIASLKANIPLETAELQGKVVDLEASLRVLHRNGADDRATLDAVARALTGQAPGPLDAEFRVAADVAKLRGRVKELEEQAQRESAALADAQGRCAELERALRASDAALRSLTSWEAGQCPDCHAPRGARHLATCKLAAAVNRNRAVLSEETPPTVPPPSQAPAQPRADEGARPCRDCQHSSRCKWLLGPSYKDAGPCDWSPSRFAATGQDDATPPDYDLLRVVEGFLRTWDEQNGDQTTLAPAIPGAVAALRRVLTLAKERPGGDPPIHAALAADARADWRIRGRALFAAVTALDRYSAEPPETQPSRVRMLRQAYEAQDAWIEIDPGAQPADVGAAPPASIGSPASGSPEPDLDALRGRLEEAVKRFAARCPHDGHGQRICAGCAALAVLYEVTRPDDPLPVVHPASTGTAAPGREDLLASSPSKLEISIRAHNALRRAGIATVRDLVAMTRAEVEALGDMGQTSTARLAEDLFAYGLTFKGDECICRDLKPPLYYVSCPHPKHRIGTVMPDRISGASEARASDAAGPEEHVHGCARCGAHMPCSSEDPDACLERVEAHCGTPPPAAGSAKVPDEHVHHCSCHGASIPCNRQDPDSCRERVDGWHKVFCRERVEAHCQATDTSHTEPPA